MVAIVVTENARTGVINEMLFTDALVLMSGTEEDLKERFWIEALESNGLKVNIKKRKVIVSGSEGEC